MHYVEEERTAWWAADGKMINDVKLVEVVFSSLTLLQQQQGHRKSPTTQDDDEEDKYYPLDGG